MQALTEFLQAHADDVVLDAAAMAQLHALMPLALTARPDLQAMLGNISDPDLVVGSTAFASPLTHEQIATLTHRLRLEVCFYLFYSV